MFCEKTEGASAQWKESTAVILSLVAITNASGEGIVWSQFISRAGTLENQDHLSTNNFLCSPRPYGLVRIFCEWETFLFLARPWKNHEIELDVCKLYLASCILPSSVWTSVWAYGFQYETELQRKFIWPSNGL